MDPTTMTLALTDDSQTAWRQWLDGCAQGIDVVESLEQDYGFKSMRSRWSRFRSGHGEEVYAWLRTEGGRGFGEALAEVLGVPLDQIRARYLSLSVRGERGLDLEGLHRQARELLDAARAEDEQRRQPGLVGAPRSREQGWLEGLDRDTFIAWAEEQSRLGALSVPGARALSESVDEGVLSFLSSLPNRDAVAFALDYVIAHPGRMTRRAMELARRAHLLDGLAAPGEDPVVNAWLRDDGALTGFFSRWLRRHGRFGARATREEINEWVREPAPATGVPSEQPAKEPTRGELLEMLETLTLHPPDSQEYADAVASAIKTTLVGVTLTRALFADERVFVTGEGGQVRLSEEFGEFGRLHMQCFLPREADDDLLVSAEYGAGLVHQAIAVCDADDIGPWVERVLGIADPLDRAQLCSHAMAAINARDDLDAIAPPPGLTRLWDITVWHAVGTTAPAELGNLYHLGDLARRWREAIVPLDFPTMASLHERVLDTDADLARRALATPNEDVAFNLVHDVPWAVSTRQLDVSFPAIVGVYPEDLRAIDVYFERAGAGDMDARRALLSLRHLSDRQLTCDEALEYSLACDPSSPPELPFELLGELSPGFLGVLSFAGQHASLLRHDDEVLSVLLSRRLARLGRGEVHTPAELARLRELVSYWSTLGYVVRLDDALDRGWTSGYVSPPPASGPGTEYTDAEGCIQADLVGYAIITERVAFLESIVTPQGLDAPRFHRRIADPSWMRRLATSRRHALLGLARLGRVEDALEKLRGPDVTIPRPPARLDLRIQWLWEPETWREFGPERTRELLGQLVDPKLLLSDYDALFCFGDGLLQVKAEHLYLDYLTRHEDPLGPITTLYNLRHELAGRIARAFDRMPGELGRALEDGHTRWLDAHPELLEPSMIPITMGSPEDIEATEVAILKGAPRELLRKWFVVEQGREIPRSLQDDESFIRRVWPDLDTRQRRQWLTDHPPTCEDDLGWRERTEYFEPPYLYRLALEHGWPTRARHDAADGFLAALAEHAAGHPVRRLPRVELREDARRWFQARWEELVDLTVARLVSAIRELEPRPTQDSNDRLVLEYHHRQLLEWALEFEGDDARRHGEELVGSMVEWFTRFGMPEGEVTDENTSAVRFWVLENITDWIRAVKIPRAQWEPHIDALWTRFDGIEHEYTRDKLDRLDASLRDDVDLGEVRATRLAERVEQVTQKPSLVWGTAKVPTGDPRRVDAFCRLVFEAESRLDAQVVYKLIDAGLTHLKPDESELLECWIYTVSDPELRRMLRARGEH